MSRRESCRAGAFEAVGPSGEAGVEFLEVVVEGELEAKADA
jgi:hypothetical protein